MSILSNIEKSGSEAIASAAIGWSLSKFYLERDNEQVLLFNMSYNKAVSDGILIGLSSITGDLVGEYALPYLSHMAINSPMLEHVLQKGLSPILT